MSGNSFGLLYCVTSFGESHGPAYGGVVDGCPPGLVLSAADLQKELDRRKPGSSRHVTQRRETDKFLYMCFHNLMLLSLLFIVGGYYVASR